MDVISITPGATVKVEHFKLGDIGSLEYNVQQEFDYRREALHTPQVINKAISSDSDWGLSGWTPTDSLEISVPAGDLWLKKGVADIGGRRFIRTGDGSIEDETGVRAGVTADGYYYVRIKYVVSTDDHSYIAEASESPESNDDKYITLAYAEVDNWPTTPYNWISLTDLRSSNTSLSPPVTFSGDTDAGTVAVLTITQTGTVEQSLEVYGGDSTFFTSGIPKKLIIYGNDTTAIRLYSGASNYVDLRADSTTNSTLFVPNIDVTTQLDVASMTLTTTDISGALSIGDLSTITLATTGASITLANAADQIATFENSGAGKLNVLVKGKITAEETGSSIAGSATVGGVTLNGNDVTADKITLSDTTNQIYLNSAGASDGIVTTASLSGGDKTYTFPNTTGTVAVSGTGAMSVNTSGQVVHSNAAGYKHVPSGGATNELLLGDGADGGAWSSTPQIVAFGTTGLINCGTNLTVGGWVKLDGNTILDSVGTTRITVGSTTTFNGDIRIDGNDIKDSGGTTRITLGSTVTINGDIRIDGNDIRDASGAVVISFDGTDSIDAIMPFSTDLDPFLVHKLYDMGTNILAWDECYADNWNNVSSWKHYANPLATIAKFRHLPGDVYETDYDNLDDWVRTRVKCKVKDAKGNLRWESGYILKSGYEKAGAREVYDERLKKDVKVGNYADGYSDEDFEHEKSYSLNKAQVVLIQAVGKLKDENDTLMTKIEELESRIDTLESA